MTAKPSDSTKFVWNSVKFEGTFKATYGKHVCAYGESTTVNSRKLYMNLLPDGDVSDDLYVTLTDGASGYEKT